MNQGAGPTPQAVWTLGVLLILADAMVSPYWHGVWAGIMANPTAASAGASAAGVQTGDYSGLWQTAGLFLLVLLLAGLAGASTDGAIISTTLLLGLWILFFLRHGQSVNRLLARLS